MGFKKIVSLWRTLFPRTIREHEQIYCSICDGRIWFWQNATRIYSLGMTRAHISPCAVDYFRAELEANHIAFTKIQQGIEETKQNLVKRNTRTIH